jgi:hypothetical protein
VASCRIETHQPLLHTSRGAYDHPEKRPVTSGLPGRRIILRCYTSDWDHLLRRNERRAVRSSHGQGRSLPPNDYVFVNWSNDYVRAPVIAYFKTNSNGVAIQSSTDVGRLAEVKGVEIVLSTATVPNPSLAVSIPAAEAGYDLPASACLGTAGGISANAG